MSILRTRDVAAGEKITSLGVVASSAEETITEISAQKEIDLQTPTCQGGKKDEMIVVEGIDAMTGAPTDATTAEETIAGTTAEETIVETNAGTIVEMTAEKTVAIIGEKIGEMIAVKKSASALAVISRGPKKIGVMIAGKKGVVHDATRAISGAKIASKTLNRDSTDPRNLKAVVADEDAASSGPVATSVATSVAEDAATSEAEAVADITKKMMTKRSASRAGTMRMPSRRLPCSLPHSK